MKQKYAVFKVKEVDTIAGGDPGEVTLELIEEVKDFMVIRFQDVFAAPGLYAYANVIQTWIERDKLEGRPIPPELEQLRDDFFEAAEQAANFPVKKIPD